MSRTPVRLRVAAAFALAMALLLTGSGLLIYSRVADDLSHALDQDLRLRAQDLSALVRDPHQPLALQPQVRLIEQGESFAELLDPRGAVIDSTRPIGRTPLIARSQVQQTLVGAPRFVDHPSVPGLDEPARLLATRVTRARRQLVLVVGATRENRAETLQSLRTELLIAGPIALVLATLLGYFVAGAGLRTVEAMRARAARITAANPGDRLPVPQTRDELQRLGQTLNEMLARLEEALQRERGFVAEAGHELRTPLGSLRAELDYALHYAKTEAELRLAVRNASEETDRLGQLAGDLLLIASADQGRIPLRKEHVHVEELLGSVQKRFAWRAEAEGRAISVESASRITVLGDRLRLEQALGNLVDNALRYGRGTVKLGATEAGRQVRLRVHDDGAGFAPEFLSRAMQRFTRADASRSSPGTGLGLAIVSTIAAAHGGQAVASNAAAGGAEVTISLPAVTEAERPSEDLLDSNSRAR